MFKKENYIIDYRLSLREALIIMNELDDDLTIFVVNEYLKLIGTLTDGDARRGLIKNLDIDSAVEKFMNKSFIAIEENKFTINDILNSKRNKIKILPIVNESGCIINLINFSFFYSYLPLDSIIMAGGEGLRLRPLTEKTPKPLLCIGNKPIMEHLIDRLVRFGINKIQISVNYLGNQIVDYFKDGLAKNISIEYIYENKKMGTIGSLSLANEIKNENILLLNSDILSNINFEDFFVDFITKDADISIACIPYEVNIPYAIMDTHNDRIIGLKEKPTLNYISNAGIYLIKKKHLKLIPENSYFNATDLVDQMLEANLNVTYYMIHDYWLDIGKMDDYNKAQKDIRHLKI